MDFIADYIAARHPNSPINSKGPAMTYLATATAQLMDETTQSIDNHLNILYCLQTGIIQPTKLPADWRAI